MVDRRHVNQISTRKGNMRCDSRTLLAERLFRHLDQNFLPLTKKLRNHRTAPRLGAVWPMMFFGLSWGWTSPAPLTAIGRPVRERSLIGPIGQAHAGGRILLGVFFGGRLFFNGLNFSGWSLRRGHGFLRRSRGDLVAPRVVR